MHKSYYNIKMLGENCRYCFNSFTLANPPLMISCSHCLCKKCIIFLSQNFQKHCFWCKCKVSYNPEGMKIHQKTYNQILKKNKKLCPNHAKVLTHISKHTFVKYCEKCLQEGNINSNEIEDIIFIQSLSLKFADYQKSIKMLKFLVE